MDFVMPGWPPRPADILNQISQRKGILPDAVRSDYALSWRYHHGAHRNGPQCGKTKDQPLIGSSPTGDFPEPELPVVLRAVEVRGRYETANRLRSTIGTNFRYADVPGRARRDVSVNITSE